VVKAFLLNILNTKLAIFFLAFLHAVHRAGPSRPLAQLLLLSRVFMAMTFIASWSTDSWRTPPAGS
jgi:threonine/homoserine/homoserine lactone efflux protein